MYRIAWEDLSMYYVDVEHTHDICLDCIVDTDYSVYSVDMSCRKTHSKNLVRSYHLGDTANLGVYTSVKHKK